MARSIEILANKDTTTAGNEPKINYNGKDQSLLFQIVEDDGTVVMSGTLGDVVVFEDGEPDNRIFSVTDVSGLQYIKVLNTGVITIGTPLAAEIEIDASGNVLMKQLPTSSAGLPTGALWNNAGVVNIV